jgi:hypothetical protein
MEAPRYKFITSLYVAFRPGRFNHGETTTYPEGRRCGKTQSQHDSFEEENPLPLQEIELPIPRQSNP